MFWKKRNKRNFFTTIRFRLIFGYSFILSAGIIAVAVYFSFQMRARLVEATKQYLSSELGTVIEMLQDEAGSGLGMSDFLSRHARGIRGSHKIGYALFDAKGLIIARSSGFLEDKNSLDMAASFSGQTALAVYESVSRDADNNVMYLATRPFKDSADNVFFLQFGAVPFGYQQAVKVFSKTIVFMIPFVLLVAFLSGALLTARFLSPISRLIRASNQIISSDAVRKLPVRGTGDELDQLACAFNNVLQKLRESYEKIVAFTADASHEIRLPITAIKGEAEVILESGTDIEGYREVMENIIIEMDRLTRIINRLLFLSRGDSGLDKLDIKKIELKNLLSRMTDFYRALAEKNNISLSFLTQEGDFYVQADPSRMQELFSNLIENAIRYTPQNGSVTLEITQKRDEYAVLISDTGIGIPQREQEKIFERFYRVDKVRSREDGGAGLGLSIAAMIAKSHKGRIGVQSQPQKGSVFTVFLPKI